MAKRFTDTNKYKKPFIRGLQGAYKLLWDYLYHDCDHAGIWIVDFEIAQLYIGKDMPINSKDAIKFFNTDEKRIIEIDNGSKWYIPSFITFQYGELNELNRAHNSVITILKKYNLYKIKPLKSPSEGAMVKDKDKDMELVKDMDILPDFFSTFLNWLHYKRKRGESYKDKASTTLAYKRLLKFSNNDPIKAVEVVEYSMSNNYAGLFELKNNNHSDQLFLKDGITPRPPRPSPQHSWSERQQKWTVL